MLDRPHHLLLLRKEHSRKVSDTAGCGVAGGVAGGCGVPGGGGVAGGVGPVVNWSVVDVEQCQL